MNKWAIVGMGFISDRHIKAIKALGGEVVMTCDIDPAKGQFTDWVQMFHHHEFKDVEYVSICTPNYLHRVIAVEALRLGKKVLCEKPLSIDGVDGLAGVKTVLQLRYNPAVKMLHKNPPKELQVIAKMYRDEKYWDSWKGVPEYSGGILYNLGVHYLDLLVHILGDEYEILEFEKEWNVAKGKIKFKKGIGSFHIEIVDNREEQIRKIIADGAEVVLSSQDNLSYEDLHKEVFKDFSQGGGIDVFEASKSLKLIEKLYEMP